MITYIIIHRFDKEAAVPKEAQQLQSVLAEYGMSGELMELHPRRPMHDYYQAIEHKQPDLVFTLDLAGFEMTTDTGEIAYINLKCRSVHWINGGIKGCFAEYFTRKLSIAMFFYCREKEVYDLLTEEYPDIPYLKRVDDWRAMAEDLLSRAMV